MLKVQDKNGFQRKKKKKKIEKKEKNKKNKKINSYGYDDKKIESQGFH